MRRPPVSTLFPYTTLFRSSTVSAAPFTATPAESVTRPADVARGNSTSSRSEEHTSELQSQSNLVCRLLLEKKKNTTTVEVAYAICVTATLRDKITLAVLHR